MTTFQTDAQTKPLRQRMHQDMVMRGLGSHTQNDYVRHVRNFAAFLGRPPDTATAEDIRHYQLHQHETGVGPATINSTVSALRFLFTVTLNRRDLSRTLVITRNPRKLPEVLSVEEAARLLEAAPGIEFNGKPANCGKAFRRLVRLAKFEKKIVRHTLRHTAATWMMQEGVDLAEAAGYLGMSLETLQERYAHHHPNYQRTAANKLAERANRARTEAKRANDLPMKQAEQTPTNNNVNY